VSVLLGVDGGGTKTAFALVDGDGAVLARIERASLYHLEHGRERFREVLAEGVQAVCAAAGIRPGEVTFGFFALPGYGESSADVPFLDAAPATVLGHDRYRCDNDMVAGWAGSLGGADGINVVAGTGSMTYGERRGRGVRVGGWGELFGDDGSAHWLGIRALNLFSRQSDGRLPTGPLLAMLRERTGISADLDLVDVVLSRWNRGRAEIAGLAPLVVAAAEAGDEGAGLLLDEAVTELVALVEATRTRLGFADGEAVPVSYSGGLFRADRIRDGFAAALRAASADYALREPLLPPVLGAALHAATLAGEPLPPAALERLGHA